MREFIEKAEEMKGGNLTLGEGISLEGGKSRLIIENITNLEGNIVSCRLKKETSDIV